MEQLDSNILSFQRRKHSINDFCLFIQSDTAITKAAISRHKLAQRFTRQVKFMFYSCLSAHSLFSQASDHTLEKCTRTSLPGNSIKTNHIAHHAPSVWYVGQNHKGLWI